MASESTRAHVLCAGTVVLMGLMSSPATAQYINSSASGSSGGVLAEGQGEFGEQGLIPPRGDVSVLAGPLANAKFGTNEEAGAQAIRIPGAQLFGDRETGQTVWFLQTGLAFGAARGLELGVFTPAMMVSPDLAHGDLPVFITWSSSGGSFDIGLRSTLTIPTDTDSFWRWNPGIHVLGRFDTGRLDLGAFFPLVFVDDETTIASLEIPLRISLDVSNGMFLGVESGVRKLNIGEGENDVFIPLGMHALYSLGAGDHRVDIGVRFNWQSFFWAGAPEDASDRVLQNAYTLTFGANGHFDIGAGAWDAAE